MTKPTPAVPDAAPRVAPRGKVSGPVSASSTWTVQPDGRYLVDVVVRTRVACQRLAVRLRAYRLVELVENPGEVAFDDLKAGDERLIRVPVKVTGDPPGTIAIDVALTGQDGVARQSTLAVSVGERPKEDPAAVGSAAQGGASKQPALPPPPGTTRQGGLILMPATPVEPGK